ncbi:MAG: hydrolase [Campylobacterota bacterium]|nr:hydrolase [Campylobacterota bacterium]
MKNSSSKCASEQCKPFKPAIGLRNGHLQTLFPALFRKQTEPEVEIETFEFNDGDFTECYWHHKPPPESQIPIVTLFHGLQGSFRSPYIQGMMHALHKVGFSSVLMHFRGCTGKENRLPRSYHSGDTADAIAWLNHLKTYYPDTPLFAVGYSLGGNMLLKLLGEQGSDPSSKTLLLKAAVSISAPMQLEASAKRMDRGFSKLYQYHLLKDLKPALLKKYDKHNIKALTGLDQKEVKNLNNFYAFDGAYTAPIHGFDSAEDYYQKSSSKQFLKKITTPTLIIHALDDPFMTDEVLPDKAELSISIEIEVYPSGGHVGFVGGSLLKPEYWLEERVVYYLEEFSESEIS